MQKVENGDFNWIIPGGLCVLVYVCVSVDVSVC